MVTPLDLLWSKNHVDPQVAKQRLSMCIECDRLFSLTNQCKECGCFMPVKVKLREADCPIGKW